MILGSLSLIATGLMTFDTGNSPINLGDNLRESVRRGRSRVESHTLSHPLGRSRGPELVSSQLVGARLFQEGAKCVHPGPMTAQNKGKGRRDTQLLFESWKQRWLIAYTQ